MKRILSIILSVLLIVGCVAISVTANSNVLTTDDVSDSANWIPGYWNETTGAFVEHAKRIATNGYVAVNSAKTYTLATQKWHSGMNFYLAEYDADKNFVAGVGKTKLSTAGTYAYTPSTADVAFVALSITINNDAVPAHTTGSSKGILERWVDNGYVFTMVAEGGDDVEEPEEEESTVPTESTTTTTTTTTTTVPVDTEGTYTIADVANPDSWAVGQYKTDGTFNPASTSRASVKKLIEVVPGTTYVIDAENNTERTFKYVIREFDADRKVIQSISGFTFGGKYTPSENVAYIALIMYDNSPYADIVAGNIKPSMTVYVEETTTTTTTEVEVPTMPEGYFTIEDVANPDNWTEGQYKDNGVFDPNNTDRACLKKLVKVVPGTTYSLYAKCDDKKSFVIREYDADKNFVNSYGVVTAGFTYAPSSDEVAYIGVSLYPGAPYADIVAGNILPAMKVQELMTDLVEMQPGVSIRLNEVNGMRFYATLNCDANEVDEMGIIIAPVDSIGNRFTTEDDHIKIPYVYKDQLWENNTFVASIVNVADRNLARDFIARAYVVIDGVTYYSKNTTTRNLAGVADAFVADENGGYAELDADTQALVESWAKAND